MLPDRPTFSIIVPTYNRAALIGETIQCFMEQTFGDFELIIVDDGSTDDTEAAIADFLRADPRVRYYRKANGERGAARNYGVQQSAGRYVTFIDSDDAAYPHALQTAHDLLEREGWPPCLALRYEVRDKDTMKISLPSPAIDAPTANEALKKSNMMGCIGVFVERSVALALPFEEDRQFAGTEDWLLWLRLAARYPIIYNNRISYCIYQHDNRSVMSFSEEKLSYRAEQIRHYLMQDDVSRKVYGIGGINRIYAHMLTYAALHLAMSRKKMRAIHYLVKGIRVNTGELFARRTFGIIKNILLK